MTDNATEAALRKQFPELEKAKMYRTVRVEAPQVPLSAEQLAQFIWKVEQVASARGKNEILVVVAPREDLQRIHSRLSPRARRGPGKWETMFWPAGEVMTVVTEDGRTGHAAGFEPKPPRSGANQ